MLETFQLANTVNSTQQKATTAIFLNTTQIDELVETIDGQIGTTTSQYNLMVKPKIDVVADITLPEADVRTLYESFAASLTIEFGKGTPNYISIENLTYTSPSKIEGTSKIFHPNVANQRMASYIATIVTIPILAITTWFYIKTKPTTPPKKPIQRIIAPYKEIIAETTQKPLETTQTITMETLEDLAKIAENLVKPILHKKGPKTTHTFYILDNDIKYEYVTEET